MRKLALLCLLASALMLHACSSDNSDAPTGSNAHPEGWIANHSVEAEPIAPGYTDCAGCHGADLSGSGDAVSCFSCHAFNAAPPFGIHPADWSEAYVNHRGYAALNGFDSCQGCHGDGLRGSAAAPSCFANSVDGRGCHAEGPGEVPHPLDGSYLTGNLHGPEAKQDLTACQPCHGEAGGPGDNPRFNVGIEAAGGNGCESCHGINYAHPQEWAVSGQDSHASAGNLPNACTLCHGANLDGIGGVGVSCLQCHVEVPGELVHAFDGSFLAGSAHGPVAKEDLTFCQGCHGESGGPGDNPRFNIGIEAAGGKGCEGCHGTFYAHPQNWAGPNNTFHYSAASIQASCTLCHGVELNAVGGVGVSCLECHDSVTSFTLDCTACHGYPPDGSPDVATSMGVDHTALLGIRFHEGCFYCHGVEESADGGGFNNARFEYRLFDKTTDTPGDHWDGNINMNSIPGYNPDNWGCTSCHGNDPEHRLSDSGLPVEFGRYLEF